MDNDIAFRTLTMVQELHGVVFDIIGMVLAFLAVCIPALIIAGNRKASSAVKKKPRRILQYASNAGGDQVFRAVLEYALTSQYYIDHVDYNGRHAILSDEPTAVSWGFFYPIYVSPDESGQTIVEVGAVSRVIQFGPVVSRCHERCFNAVKSAVWLHERQVH